MTDGSKRRHLNEDLFFFNWCVTALIRGRLALINVV